MSRRRILHFIGVSLVAALAAGAAYHFDAIRTQAHETIASLRWARQISSQAEGMAFTARTQGEADPIGWAVNFLAQGVEPRVMLIRKFQGPTGDSAEQFGWDEKQTTFEYSKVLTPENGSGIKIQIFSSSTGFLGTKSRLLGDFALLGFFFSTLLLALWLTRWWNPISLEQEPSPVEDELTSVPAIWAQSAVTEKVLKWISSAKPVLAELGSHVRDLIKNAHTLAAGSAQARSHVSDLRGQIHTGITELRARRQTLKNGEKLSTQAEVLALNLVLESSKGDDSAESAAQIAFMAEQLHVLIQEVRRMQQQSQETLDHLEKKLEPWAVDADLAFHSLNEVMGSAEAMGSEIQKTREGMVQQIHLIQSLKGEFEAEGRSDVEPSIFEDEKKKTGSQ